MKTSHLVWSGSIVAALTCSSAAFAANPGTINFTSPNSGFFQATTLTRFVNGNLTGTQPQSNVATSKVEIGAPFFGRNTDRYTATAQVRCNGSPQIFVKAINGPSSIATISCTGVGNAWAGTITIN